MRLHGSKGFSYRQWVAAALESELAVRDARWSEAMAVGNLAFVEKVKSELGVKAAHREVVQRDETYALRERSKTYGGGFAGENDGLRVENTIGRKMLKELRHTAVRPGEKTR